MPTETTIGNLARPTNNRVMSTQFKKLLQSLVKDKQLISLKASDEKRIKIIEKYFNNSIPASYKTFLEEVGDGVINGWEINGTAGNEQPSIISSDIRIKKQNNNIPKKLILLLEEDELSWFFDTEQESTNNEIKVVPWIIGLPYNEQPPSLKTFSYKSFEDFFRNKILKPTDEDRFKMNYWKKRAEELSSTNNSHSPVTAKNYLFQDIKTLYKNPMSTTEARKFMFWLTIFVVIATLLLIVFGKP